MEALQTLAANTYNSIPELIKAAEVAFGHAAKKSDRNYNAWRGSYYFMDGTVRISDHELPIEYTKAPIDARIISVNAELVAALREERSVLLRQGLKCANPERIEELTAEINALPELYTIKF
jgi:hypothetical protein